MDSPSEIAAFWDAAADTFDVEADHGLRLPRVRDAWAARLRSWIPGSTRDVLDVGCGTGSLSLVLAAHGHRVVGVDLAPAMVERARRKLADAGLQARFEVGDAAALPPFDREFDVVLARHLLWTLPDPVAALRHWIGATRPGGVLVLVEGRWNTSGDYLDSPGSLPWMGGVGADALAEALRPLVSELRVEPLVDPGLWGRVIDDERYAVVAVV
ncbi:methyltransferase domain-containing protein [Actinokineospora sp. NBRC 105648]|uniref:class I SAM-dependent methyltransferase n=1 Tax=Actinokineospora sp. NBRC 105648 TaxID=3032206 RepID=UPI0024A2BE57|nr:methyltransferase domain-containing protein [Actinokineospora sp. NBRC 105648]GLZ37228.1 SAM-dependent methyltransferase [Actinokineospora sp. NBRC 105648]